jgi:tetratricopeptide (TPR) repeat protein
VATWVKVELIKLHHSEEENDMARFRFCLGLFALIFLITLMCPWRAGLAVEKTAKYYFDQGTEHMEKGRYGQAIADLTRAIEMNPDYDKAYRQRGNVYFRQGEHDKAIADYNRAMRIAPKAARNYSNRALVYLELGKLDEALADFTEAIALDSKNAKAYSRRGRVYYEKRQYHKTISDCDQALKLNPKLAEAYFYKALACEETGRYPDAIAAFRSFVEFAPPEYESHAAIIKEKLQKLDKKETPKSK